MDFRVLGEVTAESGGTGVPLGEHQQRLFLTALLLAEGWPVPAETLVSCLWDEDPPQTAPKLIPDIASKIRAMLEAGEPGAATMLPPGKGGYRLVVPRERVDLLRFKDGKTRASELARTDPVAALRQLSTALAEWGGVAPGFEPTPFGGLHGPWIDRKREALRQDHRDALVIYAKLALRCGNPELARVELAGLAQRDPLNEGVIELLMQAYYQLGQPKDALQLYAKTRDLLKEELGNDPSPALKKMHERILAYDPTLARPTLAQPNSQIGGHVTDAGSTPDAVITTLATAASQLVAEDARSGSTDRSGAPTTRLVHRVRSEFAGDDQATVALTQVLTDPDDAEAVARLRTVLVAFLVNDTSFRRDVELLTNPQHSLATGGIVAEKIRNAAVYHDKVVVKGNFRIGG